MQIPFASISLIPAASNLACLVTTTEADAARKRPIGRLRDGGQANGCYRAVDAFSSAPKWFADPLPYSMRQQNHARARSKRVPRQILHAEVVVRIPPIVDLSADAKSRSHSDRARHRGAMIHTRSL
jgi:hypothetical protein